ncbi:hypothetical protein KDH_07860 [Dictyobacter sp. S3.2.2.5]|uniref:Carrier domain-containing protein n=1 Tax=Dictyobacter halimunensis TaxID=3026934 RepID=A0ABQ6FLQ4_9CHLR|nr:hypothetical protein KDH_07860 [Dictyobacter sp. S3.2.2.5]
METSQLHASPLSVQQARLWDFYQHNPVYHAVGAIELSGPLSLDLLSQAIGRVVERHEILRTSFYTPPGMDVPMQIVGKPNYGYQVTSLEHLSPSERQSFIDDLLLQLRAQPASIGQMPCLRCHVLTLDAARHMLIVSLPAFCADRKTLQLLGVELQQAYDSLQVPEKEETEEEEPLQYIDVSAWQNELLQEEDAAEHSMLWQHLDLSALDTFSIPGATASEETAFLPQVRQIPCSTALLPALEALANEQQVPVEHIILSAWYLFLALYTNHEEIIVGVGNDGRTYEELASIPGLYTRFVPLPAMVEIGETWTHLMHQISRTYDNALEEQNYFSWSQHDQEVCRQLPVQYTYVREHNVAGEEQGGSVTFSLRFCYQCSEPFHLKLEAIHDGDGLSLNLHFAANCFPSHEVTALTLAFSTLLEDALARPEAPMKSLRLLQSWQEQQLRARFQGPTIQFPALSLVQLFERQVIDHADEVAVLHNGVALTYAELNRRANRVAYALLGQGVGRNTVVALCVERSVEMIVGLLGILKAGGAYMALDTQLPLQRLHYQLQDAQVTTVVTQKHLCHLFMDYPVQPLILEHSEESDNDELAGEVPLDLQLTDLAYVIYTSGSTGNPKGVLIQHASVSNYIQSLWQQLAWQPGWHFATVSTLAADLGNTVIFGSLVTGGCLHILDYEIATSAARWRQYLRQHPIDVLKIVPSHLNALLASDSAVDDASVSLPRQQLILGGEALGRSLLERLVEVQAPCEIINHYGPTETTIGALVNRLGHVQQIAQGQHGEASVPIGSPIGNLSVAVMNAGGNMVPVGVAGELYIAGAGLAQGYLNKPEQTQAKFLLKRWDGQEEVRYYRTGDLARYRSDGKIEFLGRADGQVKIRGYRVELGEIEQALQKHELVQKCVALMQEGQPGGQKLVAYVVGAPSSILTEKELKTFLRERLPAYMLPQTIVQLASLPLTLNGKIDSKKLREQEPIKAESSESVEIEKTYVRPRDHIEMRLAHIWSQILSVHKIGALDDFFDLGGNSIIAVRLMSLIHKEFQCDLALSTLFKHPTLAAFARILRRDVPEEAPSIVVPLQTQGDRLPFFCVHPSGGTVFRYQAFAHALGNAQPFYGLQAPEGDQGSLSLEAMAAQYVGAIREVQPSGPYQIGGWSLGGVVAFEIAQQLTRLGEHVALLALIDSSVPPSMLTEQPLPAAATSSINDQVVADVLREEGVLSLSAEDLARYEPGIQLEHAWNQARQANRIPADTGFEQFRRLAYINCRNLLAVKYYRPEVYPGGITFFRSSEVLEWSKGRLNTEGAASPLALTGGWERLSQREIIAHIVPGPHSEMVDEPYVQELARLLSSLLSTQSQGIKAA